MDLLSFAGLSFAALFPIVNPLGAVPLFFSLSRGLSRPEMHRAELRIALYVAGILIVFLVAGPAILEFFGISLGVLKIAGGLIVANTAWSMATGRSRITEHEAADAQEREDFTFTPMAMPMLSGPGAIGVVIGLSASGSNIFHTIGIALGIVAVGLTVFVILRSSEPLSSRLHPNAVGALNRVFGFFILAIGVQLIWNGFENLMKPG